jgi:hypothetical protein
MVLGATPNEIGNLEGLPAHSIGGVPTLTVMISGQRQEGAVLSGFQVFEQQARSPTSRATQSARYRQPLAWFCISPTAPSAPTPFNGHCATPPPVWLWWHLIGTSAFC